MVQFSSADFRVTDVARNPLYAEVCPSRPFPTNTAVLVLDWFRLKTKVYVVVVGGATQGNSCESWHTFLSSALSVRKRAPEGK